MSYTKTSWVNGSSPPINASNLNKIENALESHDIYITELKRSNPQTYGAVGDGVHDDTEAINDAIQTGEYIVIPEGTYKTTGTILINKECVVQCFGTIAYTGTGSAVKITGSIANRTDLYFRDIEAYNGTGIEFYSSYYNSSSDNDRVMYVNLWFDHIKAKDKGIWFHRGATGSPNTDGYINEIHIYNGKFGGDVDYGIYADSGNYSAINNVKFINLSLEGAKTGIYLKDNIYRWSFINLRYADAPTYYHLQTVGLVSDIMWFGTNKLYENYVSLSANTTGLLISPMAKNANYYVARINAGALEYLDPLIDKAVQVGSNVNSANVAFATSNNRLQWTCEGSFTISGVTYTKLMVFIGANGDIGFSGHNGSSWTQLAKSTLTVDSTITTGGTNPVNSTAVIAYINSLDASNTAY